MKKVTSTLTILLLCLYVSAQVGTLEGGFNSTGYATVNLSPIVTVPVTLNPPNDKGTAVATHSDGRVVAIAFANDKSFTVVRYLSNGTLDPAFGTGGIVRLKEVSNADAFPNAIIVTSDNKILIAGSSWVSSMDFAILKLLEDGTPDPSFGGGDGWASVDIGSFRDEATGIAVQSDGKIVVAGNAETGSLYSGIYNFGVARFNANGTLDNLGFGTNGIVNININGDDRVTGVVLQSDGKIIVGGSSNYSTNNSNYTAVRLNTDGSIDNTTYGVNGIANIDIAGFGAGSNDWGNAIAIQPDGKVIMTGQTHASSGGNGHIATLRLTTTGALDASWNPTGAIVNPYGGTTNTVAGIAVFNVGVINNDEGTRSIGIQSDGKIIVGGDGDGEGSSFDLLLIRYNTNGTPDVSFNTDGLATAEISTGGDFGNGIKLFGDRIYITGTTPGTDGTDFVLAAFENDGSPLPLVLSQFYAQKQTSKVVLQWQTTSEEGVKQFVIERSNDGKTYKAIGQVAATGNSTTKKNYNFTDQSPFASTNNYYRLLMQDVDGNYKYSKILIVKFDGETSMQVFPSTVKDLLQVQLPNGLNGNVTLQIIDMNGRVIKRNTLAADGNGVSTTIDVSNLVKGVYILKAQAGNTSLISRFTKQ